jgi:hypothetical protein
MLSGTPPLGAPRWGGPATLIFSVISGIDPLTPLVVLLLGMVGGMYWLVLWLVAYSALDFLYTQVAALRRIS